MKRLLIGSLFCAFAIGCATDSVEGEDFDDPDAKADGPNQPSGLYKVIEPEGGFDEGQPRIAIMDLRSDGTYYSTEYGPVQYDEYNFGEGVSETFGAYRFTKDRYGNRFIRFTEDAARDTDNSWRWRFTATSTALSLSFIYRTGDVGFKMRRETRPTASFVNHVKEGFSSATRTTVYDPTPSHWTGEIPEALASRVTDLRIAYPDHVDSIKASRISVDGSRVFILEWSAPEAHVEIFALNSQLLAKTKTVEPLAWAELRP